MPLKLSNVSQCRWGEAQSKTSPKTKSQISWKVCHWSSTIWANRDEVKPKANTPPKTQIFFCFFQMCISSVGITLFPLWDFSYICLWIFFSYTSAHVWPPTPSKTQNHKKKKPLGINKHLTWYNSENQNSQKHRIWASKNAFDMNTHLTSYTFQKQSPQK